MFRHTHPECRVSEFLKKSKTKEVSLRLRELRDRMTFKRCRMLAELSVIRRGTLQ